MHAKIANAAFQQQYPNYFGAHYAAALLATRDGNAAKQRQEMATARQLWSHADPDLRELAQVSASGTR